MSDDLVLYGVAEGIASITLNNPRKRNALSTPLMTALQACLDAARDDSAVRVVVIKANGPVFSAGHDLGELHGRCDTDYAGVFRQCTALMESIRLLPKPVIAQVDGLATAAGCQLVATCDLAVASDTSHFATPGVKIGLFCTTPGVAVARAMTPKKAMEMLLTGAPLTADQAERAGLLNAVVPAAELDTAVHAMAAKIAEASAQTVAIGKEAFYRQVEMDRPAAYAYAGEVMVKNLLAEDAAEGISAFIEKRPPHWKH